MPNSARRRTAPAPRVAALVAIVCAWLSFIPAPAAAQQEALFVENSASASFGEALLFELTVEAEYPIEIIELFWRPEGDPELSASYPEFTPDVVVELEHEVDLTFDWLPPGLDIVYFWRVVDARGNTTDSGAQVVFYMDDSQDWETLTNGLVTVWWHAGTDDFAGQILASADRTIAGLAERFAVAADEPIRIVIYGSDDAFMEALPPNSADWIGGQAHPALNLIVAQLAPGGGATRGIGRMIPHEVSHLILHQATENPWNSPPNWLDEGLAVYNQETPDADLPRILDDATEDGRLIPVRALNSSFPLDPGQAYLSYAESHSIVQFIIEELGEERMAALIAVFRDEVSYDEAVERALGMTLDELDAAWKAWLGYAGDAPPSGSGDEPDQPRAQTELEDDSDFTPGEKIFALSCTGAFALGGLALFVVALRRLRALPGRG